MKNLIIIITVFAALFLGATAFVDNRHEATLGHHVPSVVLGEGEEAMTLDSMKGKWVILSFWSAADAESRMDRNRIEAFMRGADADVANRVEVVSVNMDRSQLLMQEIARNDSLEGNHLHVASPETVSALRSAFRMDRGLRSFIINPEGKLVAADPTTSDFERLLSNAA